VQVDAADRLSREAVNRGGDDHRGDNQDAEGNAARKHV
jgi:hypothetical protein